MLLLWFKNFNLIGLKQLVLFFEFNVKKNRSNKICLIQRIQQSSLQRSYAWVSFLLSKYFLLFNTHLKQTKPV